MRRLISRLLLCLALGLLTTIAIAWTSAAFALPAKMVQMTFVETDVVSTLRGWTSDRVCLSESGSISWMGPIPRIGTRAIEGFRNKLTQLAASGKFPPAWGRMPDPECVRGFRAADLLSWTQDARGWPFLALWCEWVEGGDALNLPRIQGGVPVDRAASAPGRPRAARALPYRPIPLGLAADTLLFALAWSLLLYTKAIRRRIRLSRNQCPRCAYNLAGLPPHSPCPECGSPSSPAGGGGSASPPEGAPSSSSSTTAP